MKTECQKAIAHLSKETPEGSTYELPRGRITFEVQPKVCRPGAFQAPFKLTLEAGTPATESQAEQRAMRVLGVAKGQREMVDPTSLLLRTQKEMAFLSIVEFNGASLPLHEKEML